MTSKLVQRKPSGNTTVTGKENNSLAIQKSNSSEPGIE